MQFIKYFAYLKSFYAYKTPLRYIHIWDIIITLNITEKEAQTLNKFSRVYRKLVAEPELKPKLSELKNGDLFIHPVKAIYG